MSENQHLVDSIAVELAQFQNWDSSKFDFDFPKSEFTGNRAIIDAGTLIRPPDSNECRDLALDHGRPIRLNEEQLRELRQTGRFNVPSAKYPGQNHTWQVNQMLQKGNDKTKESLMMGLTQTCHQLVVNVPDRIYQGKYLTMANSIKMIGTGLWNIPCLLFGWINMKPKHSTLEVSDLTEMSIANKIIDLILDMDKILDDTITVKTTQGIELNIIVAQRKKLVENLASSSYALFKRGWDNCQTIRQAGLYKDLEEKNPLDDENTILKKVANEDNRLTQEAIFQWINKELPSEQAGPLISLLQAIVIIKNYTLLYERDQKNAVDECEKHLIANHPILSRIPDWLQKQKNYFLQEWQKNHPFDLYFGQISDQLTGQEKFIFDNYLQIKNSADMKLYEKNLTKEMIPCRTFKFRFRMWNSNNWKKECTDNYWSLKKYTTMKNTSTYPGWRLVNMFLQILQNFNNFNYFLLANVFMGPFGLRSLWGIDDFHADWNIDSSTGQLLPKYQHQTWLGRVVGLWTNIVRSRNTFESKPDTGILGKSFTRIFNMAWNYGLKGIIGSILIFVGHPLLFMINTVFSLGCVVLSPIIDPAFAVLQYLFNILVFDFDVHSDKSFRWFPLFRIIIDKCLVRGLGQLLVSLFAVVGHLIIGGCIFSWTLFSNSMRYVYDSVMYHLILRHKAKIPIDDGFLVKRVSGPGLSSNYFYLVDYNIALMMLQYQLETLEMDAYVRQTKKKINWRLDSLLSFFTVFRKVAMKPDHNAEPIRTFTKTRDELEDQLEKMVSKHWQNHVVVGKFAEINKIRMSTNDLDIALEQGASVCETYFTKHIFDRMDSDEYSSFWNSKSLVPNDWTGLTSYCYRRVFNDSILTPVEDIDKNGFHLVVDNSKARTIVRDLFNGDPKDGMSTRSVNPITKMRIMPASDYALAIPNDLLQENKMLTINSQLLYRRRYPEKL